MSEVGDAKETVYAIYVLEPGTETLVRAVSLRELLVASRAANVLEIGSKRHPLTVGPATDREEVARIISRYNFLAVPVVDASSRILGIVTVDDVIDTLVKEQTEDGSMLPFLLKRIGFDPASASAPFVATLVDVTGLVIYFSVAFLMLRGTLL